MGFNVFMERGCAASHDRREAARLMDVLAQKVKLQLLLERDPIRAKSMTKSSFAAAASKLMEAEVRQQTFTNEPCQPATRLSRTAPRREPVEKQAGRPSWQVGREQSASKIIRCWGTNTQDTSGNTLLVKLAPTPEQKSMSATDSSSGAGKCGSFEQTC